MILAYRQDFILVVDNFFGTPSQKREGFIDDVITGQLNYYKSRIIEPKIEIENNKAKMKVDVEFDCLVYGTKGVFTLKCVNDFEKKNNKWYFIK